MRVSRLCAKGFIYHWRYNFCYTQGMKTAVSVPDPVFAAAEKAAKRRGISRSKLYTEALRQWLAQSRDQELAAALERAYGGEDSRLDAGLSALQAYSLARESGQEDW